MRRYDTVLFDLDGTLLDTLDDLRDSVNHVLTAHGYPAREGGEVRRLLGNGGRALLAGALPRGEETPGFEDLLREYTAWYTAHSRVKTRPYPGTEALLAGLRAAGCAVAVVSNKHAAAVEDLNARFFQADVAVGQRENLARKPAPDMAYEALARLGRDRAGAVYVGDSEVDFQTAQNAGLPCVLVAWGFRDRPELEALGPCFLADSQAELLAFLTGAAQSE